MRNFHKQAGMILKLFNDGFAEYTYSEHYGVTIKFDLHKAVMIEPEGENTFWVGDTARRGVEHFCQTVFRVRERAAKAFLSVPPGNLEDMGGEIGLMTAYLIAETADEYATAEVTEDDPGKRIYRCASCGQTVQGFNAKDEIECCANKDMQREYETSNIV
jgi:hypothetical protein